MIRNPKVPGGYKKQASIIFEIPTPRAKRTSSGDGNKTFPHRSVKNKVADKINHFTTEITGRSLNTNLLKVGRNDVLKTLLRKQGKENLKDIISPDMEQSQAFTPAQAGAVVTDSQMPRRQIRLQEQLQNLEDEDFSAMKRLFIKQLNRKQRTFH